MHWFCYLQITLKSIGCRRIAFSVNFLIENNDAAGGVKLISKLIKIKNYFRLNEDIYAKDAFVAAIVIFVIAFVFIVGLSIYQTIKVK